MSLTVTRAFDEVMVPNYTRRICSGQRAGGPALGSGWPGISGFAGGIAVNSLGHCHPQLVEALTEQAETLACFQCHDQRTGIAAGQKADGRHIRRGGCFSAIPAQKPMKPASSWPANTPWITMVQARTSSWRPATAFMAGRCLRSRSTRAAEIRGKVLRRHRPVSRHCDYNDIASLEARRQGGGRGRHRAGAYRSGVLPADPGFLHAARELADRYHALLIFDECRPAPAVRVPCMPTCITIVVPDILSSAKSLGGGFNPGAMLTTAKVAASFSVGTHGSTYGGNPLATAVAERVIELSIHRLLDGVNQATAVCRVCGPSVKSSGFFPKCAAWGCCWGPSWRRPMAVGPRM